MSINRNKMVKRILYIQNKVFVKFSVDNEKELQSKTDDELLRYYKMHERLFSEEKNNINNEEYIECEICKKYLGKAEIEKGKICFECLAE